MRFLPATFYFLLSLSSVSYATDYFVASWNVENLFDSVDDPQKEDFKPSAWTAQKLDTKLANLAKVIRDMNGGQGPDVLGLCEVENEQVVKDLVAKVALSGRDYKIVHQDSPDERGIDCAVVYDASTFSLEDKNFHVLQIAGNATRDIAEAKLTIDSDVLYVFMNHWPSQNNPEADREAAGTLLRQRLDIILAANSAADIVLLGDFNDFPAATSIKTSLKTSSTSQNLQGGTFFNSTHQMHQPPNQGTYVFNNKWGLIDHVIVSPGLLGGSGFKWKSNSTKAIKADYQLTPASGSSIAKPRITGSSNFDSGGYSDHLPVGCTLQR